MTLIVEAEPWCECEMGADNEHTDRCGDVAISLCECCGTPLCESHEIVCIRCSSPVCRKCDHVCLVDTDKAQFIAA